MLDHVKVKGKRNAVELIQVLDRSVADVGLQTFAAARGLYRERQWDAAIAKFREASSFLSISAEVRDGPCAMFIERCEDLKIHAPAPDWDGSHEMLSK